MTANKKASRSTVKKNGRPQKITAAVVEEVSAHMALGVPEEYACALAGVNPATFGPAVSRSEEFKAIKRRHDARFMVESLSIIRAGGEKIELAAGQDKEGNPIVEEKMMPWTGRAWILERRYKPHFNRTEVLKPKEDANEAGGLLTRKDLDEMEQMARKLFTGRKE